MNIYCPVCGEPWDMDMLHAVTNRSCEAARRRFHTEGCALFDTHHNCPGDPETAARSSVLFDLLGDDVDAIAAEMDDRAA
jgi:hypothetical protein